MKRLLKYLGSPGLAVGLVHGALLHLVVPTAIPEEPKYKKPRTGTSRRSLPVDTLPTPWGALV